MASSGHQTIKKDSNMPRLSFVKRPRISCPVIPASIHVTRVNVHNLSQSRSYQSSYEKMNNSEFASSSNQLSFQDNKKRVSIQLNDIPSIQRKSQISSILNGNRIRPSIIGENSLNITMSDEMKMNYSTEKKLQRTTNRFKRFIDKTIPIFRAPVKESKRSTDRKKRRGAFAMTPSCCCLTIGAGIAAAILLGTLLTAIAFITTKSTSTDTTSAKTPSTTVTTTSVTTIASSTSTVTTGTSITTSATTVTTSTISTTTSSTTVATSTTNSTTVTTITTKTTATVTITTTTVTTTTVSETTTTISITTSTRTTTSTTTTRTATSSTTSFDTCNGVQWSTTGIRVAGDGSEGSGASQLKEPRCVYVDANDTVYVCDTANSRIQKWPKGASTGITVAGGSEGTGSKQLKKPLGLTFDNNANMYVADTENHRVQKFTPSSTVGTTVAGNNGGSSGSSNNQLDKPTGIAVDDNGNLLIADYNNGRVMHYASGASSGTIAFGSGSSFSKPYGIAFRNTSSNQLYVSDENSQRLQLWTIGASIADATIRNGSPFIKANSIAVDWYGNAYVADQGSHQVQMFCSGSSTYRTVVGGSSGTTPSLLEQAGIAFDSNMNLYVTSKTPPGVYKYLRI